jgi:hypothetical protein
MESTAIKPEKPHPAPGLHASTTPGAQYEFGDSENAIIGGLASKMHFVGIFTLAVGVFVICLGAYFFTVASILSGTLYAVIGLWTHRASVSFKKTADTRGKDISHLMLALRDLRNLYSLQVWICSFTLAAALVGCVVLLWQARA